MLFVVLRIVCEGIQVVSREQLSLNDSLVNRHLHDLSSRLTKHHLLVAHFHFELEYFVDRHELWRLHFESYFFRFLLMNVDMAVSEMNQTHELIHISDD